MHLHTFQLTSHLETIQKAFLKMNIILVGIWGLRRVSENKKGVAIVTQPLSGKLFIKKLVRQNKVATIYGVLGLSQMCALPLGAAAKRSGLYSCRFFFLSSPLVTFLPEGIVLGF